MRRVALLLASALRSRTGEKSALRPTHKKSESNFGPFPHQQIAHYLYAHAASAMAAPAKDLKVSLSLKCTVSMLLVDARVGRLV